MDYGKRWMCFPLLMALWQTNVYAGGPSDLERWDADSPPTNLYSEGRIPACKGCDTFVVSVSSRPLDPGLLKSFRAVATKAGKRHVGASIRRNQLLENAAAIKQLRCELPSNTQNDVVYFAFVPEQNCIMIAYKDQRVLREALERMYAYLDDRERAQGGLASAKLKGDARTVAEQAHEFLKEHYEMLKDLVAAMGGRGRASPALK